MLNCRNQTGTRALTYSADGGQSWSAPVFHETLIGQVGLLYEQPYSSIQFTQFRLEWLLQGAVP